MNAIINEKNIYPKKIRFFGSTKCSNMLIKKSINLLSIICLNSGVLAQR